MEYLVTARKWRPNRFEDVVGQEHISVTLKNAIKNNRIAHAYIFAGPRGVGKTTTARILAKTLNCLNPVDFEPCNKCEMCESFNSSQSLDIIEIDGASNRRIEEIRTLRESVKYAPTKGKYKVYIIDEVHMLTNESFNALLKTLEEPPEHTIFIFATTDVHKVPLTIISRCQRFDFRRIDLNQIKSLLAKIAKSEKIEIDDQSLTIIGKKADGALRDAESIFDQIISFSGNKVIASEVSKMLNLIDEDIYFTLTDAILEKKFVVSYEITKAVYENGWNFVDFLNGLLEHFRNLMTVTLTQNSEYIETSENYRTIYLKHKSSFSETDLLKILNLISKTIQDLKFAQNTRLQVEILLNNLIGIYKSGSIQEIINNLEEIKKKSTDKIVNEKNVEYNETKTFKFPEIPIKKENTISKETEIKQESEPDSVELNLDKSWESFLIYLKNIKPFIAQFLTTFICDKKDGKITLTGIDIETVNIIKKEKEFLEDEVMNFFNEKLKIEVEIDLLNNQKSASILTENETSPLVKSIFKLLDGKEIK